MAAQRHNDSDTMRALRALVLHLGSFHPVAGARAWNAVRSRGPAPLRPFAFGWQVKTYKLVSKPGSPFLRWVCDGSIGPICETKEAAEAYGPATGPATLAPTMPHLECAHNGLVLDLDAMFEAAEESRIRLGVVTYWLCYKYRGNRIGLAIGQTQHVGRSKMLFLVKRLGSCTRKQFAGLARSADILHVARVKTIPMTAGARLEVG